MKPSVLVVASEYPFPPRSGSTIPVYNYIRLLAQDWTVDLLVLAPTPRDRAPTQLVRDVFFAAPAEPKWLRASRELLLRDPYFAHYPEITEALRERLIGARYRHILASPISAVAAMRRISEILRAAGQDPACTAAVSDCQTAVLAAKEHGRDLVGKISDARDRLRSLLMRYHEPRLLAECNEILVQSDEDRAWLRRIGGDDLFRRTRVLCNGVDEELLDMPLDERASPRDCLFVATLAGRHYRDRLLTLYNDVWRKLDRQGARLHVHGRGLSRENPIERALIEDPSVVYHERFVEELCDIYRNRQLMFAPIFQGYGFINKVGEGMAAGLVVIGDKTAFNGIRGFRDGVHGVVADTSDAMLAVAREMLDDPARTLEIRRQAKALARREFSWQGRRPVGDTYLKPRTSPMGA